MSSSMYPVAIVGAGPYGLAAAAHLRAAGVEARVFGEPMVFWNDQMTIGMCLRSAWEASHIADPHRALTLEAYEAEHGVKISKPIPLDDFVRYGLWFQSQVVPDVDRRQVARIAPQEGGFRLHLDDGTPISAERVVLATGIAPFAWRPPRFDDLSPALATHSSEQRDFAPFAGRQVAVVGGGQSALESAALLREAGAEVEVLVRAPRVVWLRGGLIKRRAGPLRSLLYPSTDVGPLGLNWIVAVPELFRRLPRDVQRWVAYRSIRPAGASWLPARLKGVPITTGRAVTAARPVDGRLHLTLDDGTERRVDHMLLATGYRVDVSRYGFLAPEIVRVLDRVDGYPNLGRGFESSIAGLHFLGAPAAESFGPLFRFVSGSGYAARALTRRVVAGTTRSPEPSVSAVVA